MDLNSKFLIADVFDCYLVDSNGNTIMAEEDNSDVSFSLKTNVTEVKAGQGNKLFATLRSKEAPEITMTSPKLNLENLARSLGQDIVTGVDEGISKAIKIRVDSTMKYTLKNEPKDATKLKLSKNGTDLTVTTDYTYADKVITFVEEGQVEEGDVIIVTPYMYATSEKASKIVIDATSFPEGVKLVLSTFAINKSDKKQGLLQITFYDAVADGSLDFATKSERSAVDNKVTYKAVAGEDDTYGKIVFIPEV